MSVEPGARSSSLLSYLKNTTHCSPFPRKVISEGSPLSRIVRTGNRGFFSVRGSARNASPRCRSFLILLVGSSSVYRSDHRSRSTNKSNEINNWFRREASRMGAATAGAATSGEEASEFAAASASEEAARRQFEAPGGSRTGFAKKYKVIGEQARQTENSRSVAQASYLFGLEFCLEATRGRKSANSNVISLKDPPPRQISNKII